MREETKEWCDYEKLPEEIPEFPLIRRMLLGAVSVVQTPRLRAFETNERRVAKFSETMDPCFVGRNAAVLQHTQFVYTDQAAYTDSLDFNFLSDFENSADVYTDSLDFNFLSDFENSADALETTEPADEGTSTLEPPSAFMETNGNLPESSSPGNSKDNEQRLLMDSPRRRRRRCQSTLLGNVTRRGVGGTSPRP